MPISIQLQAVGWETHDLPDGGRLLRFLDPQTGIDVLIPLDKSAREKLSRELSGKQIQVARLDQMPRQRRRSE